MVQSCCVNNCTERYTKGSGISFHMFPTDVNLRRKWILAIQRENFDPNTHTRICSKHFAPDCFIANPWSSKKDLVKDAVPTIFHFVNQNINETLQPREISTSSNEIPGNEDSLVRKKRFCYVGDFKQDTVSSDDYRYRNTVNKALSEKQKKIKILQQKNRRLTKKLSEFKSSLEQLKKEALINGNLPSKISATPENDNLDIPDFKNEDNENSQSTSPIPSPSPSHHSTSTSFQIAQRRRKYAMELREADKEITEFGAIRKVAPHEEEDECELYGRLLAKKLRKLPEWERQLIMHDIDGLALNAMHRFLGTGSTSHIDRQPPHSTGFTSSHDLPDEEEHTEDLDVDSKADIITLHDQKLLE